MDPQLTKQLYKRRLVFENSLDALINNENNIVKKVETISTLSTNNVSTNSVKNNFLEKIKKFESFSNSQTKITQPVVVDKFRCPWRYQFVNKFNKLNSNSVAAKTTLRENQFEFQAPKELSDDTKQKQDDFYDKIKQFESSLVTENMVPRENAGNNVKGPLKVKVLANALKIKSCGKSDYNNWKIDEKWTFSADYPADTNNKKDN